MKIVIDIPKRYYEDFELQLPILNRGVPSENAKYVIATGIPLPEGCKIIDATALQEHLALVPMEDRTYREAVEIIDRFPSITEPYKAESEVEK